MVIQGVTGCSLVAITDCGTHTHTYCIWIGVSRSECECVCVRVPASLSVCPRKCLGLQLTIAIHNTSIPPVYIVVCSICYILWVGYWLIFIFIIFPHGTIQLDKSKSQRLMLTSTVGGGGRTVWGEFTKLKS